MNRFIAIAGRFVSSPGLTPVVIGCFLILYCIIAFGTDDALAVVMELVRNYPLLWILLGLIPLNAAARIVKEIRQVLARREVARGKSEKLQFLPFDEEVVFEGSFDSEALGARFRSSGYRVRCSATTLSAWRGYSVTPFRILLFLSLFCLSAGILISVTTRTAHRETVIEGEPFPFSNDGLSVRRISVANVKGWFFQQNLKITAGVQGGGPVKSFGLYPPASMGGAFVYPRYLGVAPLIRFSAPDLNGTAESYYVLMVYPPGKEDSADIAGSPYRIYFSLSVNGSGVEAYDTGDFLLQFRLAKGKETVMSGSLPPGGVFTREGYRIEFPGFRRVVATDFVSDNGVWLIWLATVLAGVTCFIVPIRLFFPRREAEFLLAHGKILAFSRADGKRRRHEEIFHEALDFIDTGKSCGTY